MAGIYNHSKTYLDVYNEEIAPKLKELDLFLKAREMPVTIWQASQILDMPYSGVQELVRILDFNNINYTNIFLLIQNGSSQICRLIQRETELGFPSRYTAQYISYIYEIGENKVTQALGKLGLVEINSDNINRVFDLLPADC